MPTMECPRFCVVGELEYEVDTGPDNADEPVVGIVCWTDGGGLAQTGCGCTWGDDEMSGLHRLAEAHYAALAPPPTQEQEPL